MLRHNPRQTFSQFAEGPFPPEAYPWRFDTGRDSIMMVWTDWIKGNCQQPWAWWFDERGICQVGFMDRDEMVEFAILYNVD